MKEKSMPKTYQIHKSTWRNIPIEVHFCEIWSNAVSKNYGENFSNLEVYQADKIKLPITETGYISHFIFASRVYQEGTPLEYVHKWLDHDAQSSEWKRHEKESKQLNLF